MSLEFPSPAWSGDVSMLVHDNSGAPANVLDINNPWSVHVDVTITDPFKLLTGEMQVHVFAESFGPGPEPHLGTTSFTLVPDSSAPKTYSVHVNVPGNSPALAAASDPPAVSSIYKLVAVVEHRIAGVETVIAGYTEGPVVHLRKP